MYQKQSVKKSKFGNCVVKSAKNWPEFLIYQSKIVPNLQIRTNIAIISWTISNLMKTRVKLEFKSESWGFCRVRTKSEINEWGRVSRSGKTRKFSGFEWSSRLKLEWGWGQSSLAQVLYRCFRWKFLALAPKKLHALKKTCSTRWRNHFFELRAPFLSLTWFSAFLAYSRFHITWPVLKPVFWSSQKS